MREFFWRLLAEFLSMPGTATWIIQRAQRTPYVHLDGYMMRWWLFNPYDVEMSWWRKRLPSIRVHHILRADTDQHMHDHPWDARTIILRGAYVESYLHRGGSFTAFRTPGDTRAIRFGEYHHIDRVYYGGVYTLFFTWKYMGTWGFLVDGKKIPWREYLGVDS